MLASISHENCIRVPVAPLGMACIHKFSAAPHLSECFLHLVPLAHWYYLPGP